MAVQLHGHETGCISMRVNLQRSLLIGGFALLAVVAVLGWTRNASAPAPLSTPAPNGYYTSVNDNPPVNAPAPRDAYGAVSPENPDVPAPGAAPPDSAGYDSPYNSPYSTPRYVHVVRPVAPPPVNQPQEADRSAAPAPERRYVVVKPSHTGRSKTKSAEIVAGTAGVGAVIGAIAGGGKGAALGALTGGGAGFVYDRLTHNR
jgi:hypothetical protein